MRNFLKSAILITSLAAHPFSSRAETLSQFQQYAQACVENLGISSVPAFSCDVEKFRTAFSGGYLGLDFSLSDDFVGHKRINNSVDALYACRWVGNKGEGRAAGSGEMIIHNRKTGATCFFEARDQHKNRFYPHIELSPPSPTATNAFTYWKVPVITCTNCHSAGPYIASPQIVGALAKFGLINDGHDTLNKKYHAVGPRNSPVVNRLNNGIMTAYKAGCAAACHSMGGHPPVPSLIGTDFRPDQVLIPSINHVIDDLLHTGEMPPRDQYSDYRWLNRDTPGSSGDHERLSDFKADKAAGILDFSSFYCNNPVRMEMRRVGSTILLSAGQDGQLGYVRTFNLQDGLVCNNADYPAKHPYKCFDYQTRYKCDGEWTSWFNTDNPSGTQDNESRSRIQGLCSNPTDIQARYRAPVSGAPWVGPYYGPRDRLRQFDSKGLLCKNEDQDNGKCNNYSVRFICQ